MMSSVCVQGQGHTLTLMSKLTACTPIWRSRWSSLQGVRGKAQLSDMADAELANATHVSTRRICFFDYSFAFERRPVTHLWMWACILLYRSRIKREKASPVRSRACSDTMTQASSQSCRSIQETGSIHPKILDYKRYDGHYSLLFTKYVKPILKVSSLVCTVFDVQVKH